MYVHRHVHMMVRWNAGTLIGTTMEWYVNKAVPMYHIKRTDIISSFICNKCGWTLDQRRWYVGRLFTISTKNAP